LRVRSAIWPIRKMLCLFDFEAAISLWQVASTLIFHFNFDLDTSPSTYISNLAGIPLNKKYCTWQELNPKPLNYPNILKPLSYASSCILNYLIYYKHPASHQWAAMAKISATQRYMITNVNVATLHFYALPTFCAIQCQRFQTNTSITTQKRLLHYKFNKLLSIMGRMADHCHCTCDHVSPDSFPKWFQPMCWEGNSVHTEQHGHHSIITRLTSCASRLCALRVQNFGVWEK
jgi:hypothetical protein